MYPFYDILGRKIEIGDVVFRLVASRKNETNEIPSIVVGYGEEFVLVNDNVHRAPRSLLVITDQLNANGNDVWTTQLEAKYAEYLRAGHARWEHQKRELEIIGLL